MKFETPDGRLFSLKVEGYEFPDEDLGTTEDNPAEDFETARFLVVSHTFRNAEGEWEACGPTMTTFELQRFTDWLESILIGHPSGGGVYFTERELEFTVDDKQNVLRVHLHGSFRPTCASSADTVTIDFPLTQIDLGLAIRSLRHQLAQFPGRPPIADAT